jgi:hypothetical protein
MLLGMLLGMFDLVFQVPKSSSSSLRIRGRRVMPYPERLAKQ